jgi:hypothetical protein
MWMQNGARGVLAIVLGVILLIVAAVTLLRPDKPTDPPASEDPADGTEQAEGSEPADGSKALTSDYLLK